uniref:Uncharacterized protein n=1 Tax=Glossina brevipalpis TaxID=37001 RepID=A0A1A9W084_9MUSC
MKPYIYRPLSLGKCSLNNNNRNNKKKNKDFVLDCISDEISFRPLVSDICVRVCFYISAGKFIINHKLNAALVYHKTTTLVRNNNGEAMETMPFNDKYGLGFYMGNEYTIAFVVHGKFVFVLYRYFLQFLKLIIE